MLLGQRQRGHKPVDATLEVGIPVSSLKILGSEGESGLPGRHHSINRNS